MCSSSTSLLHDSQVAEAIGALTAAAAVPRDPRDGGGHWSVPSVVGFSFRARSDEPHRLVLRLLGLDRRRLSALCSTREIASASVVPGRDGGSAGAARGSMSLVELDHTSAFAPNTTIVLSFTGRALSGSTKRRN
jgi:hypothetical protein